MSQSLRCIAVLLTLMGAPYGLLALTAGITVDAKLSHRVAEAGSPMQLQISVSGGDIDGGAPNPKVDGLEIHYIGPSRSSRFELNNGRMKSSVDTTYIYQVVAEREGDFTIPGVTVEVNGKSYTTKPIALKVKKGNAGGTGESDASDAVGFAEIEVEKKTAYLGEVLPVEVRLYIRAGVRPEIASTVEIAGDGFTVQKAAEPQQQSEMRGDKEYYVFSYRTVMTPTKAGKLSVGPCSIPFVAQVPLPQKEARRRMDPFDGTAFDDLWDQLSGRGGRYSERRRYNAKAPAVEIDVKPLPPEGRPKNFGGAVGTFSFQGEGSPTRLKVGDPVTMKLKVTGTGNFDRVTAPTMESNKGWQTYDASENFEPVDQLKTTGTKSFELPIVADGPQSETPTFAFSYFDPKTEKYVTLRSKPQPLTIEGEPIPPVTAKPEIVSKPSPEEKPAQSEAKPASDLLGLRYEIGTVRMFSPVYARREFWMVQAIPAAGVLGLLAMRLLRRDPRRSRHAALERQKAGIFRQLRSDQNAADFWEHAARLIQIDTAIVAGVDAGSVDGDTVRRTRNLDEEALVTVDDIFERRGALLFAGRGSMDGDVSPEQRARIIATLERIVRR